MMDYTGWVPWWWCVITFAMGYGIFAVANWVQNEVNDEERK